MKRKISKHLRHQITFLSNLAKSELDKEDWIESFNCYAEIRPICDNKFTSLEGINFGHIMTEGFFIFNVRFMKDINAKMRISFKDRIFEIKRIINTMERDFILQIIALEI